MPPRPGPSRDFHANWLPWFDSIATGKLDIESPSTGKFELYAATRLSGKPDPLGWADLVSLTALGRVSYILGATLLPKPNDPGTEERRDGGTEAMALDRGFQVLKGGPESIATALMEVRCRTAEPQSLPYGRYSPLYEWLKSVQGKTPEFRPLKKIVVDHILDTWPLAQGEKILGKMTGERRYHSVLTAASAHEMRPKHVFGLLTDAMLEGRLNLPPYERIYPAADVSLLLDPVSAFDSMRKAGDVEELYG